jgi:hypothetical protein
MSNKQFNIDWQSVVGFVLKCSASEMHKKYVAFGQINHGVRF